MKKKKRMGFVCIKVRAFLSDTVAVDFSSSLAVKFKCLTNYTGFGFALFDFFLFLLAWNHTTEIFELSRRIYHTFLLHLIDWIALIWTFFFLFFCRKLAVFVLLHNRLRHCVAHAHLFYLFLSFLSFLSFFCFTDHFRSLSPFVFPTQRTAWRQKLALFFLARGENHVHCFLFFFCWEKPGTPKDNHTGRTGGKQYTINRTDLSRWQSGTLGFYGGLAFPKAHLELVENCSRFFPKNFYLFSVFWTPETCRGHTN